MADPRPAAGGPIRTGRAQSRNFLGTYNISLRDEPALFWMRVAAERSLEDWTTLVNEHTRATWSVSALALQLEIAPTTGMRHVQWFIQFAAKHRWSAVARVLRNLFGAGVHVEIARHPAEAFAYCQKDDTRFPGTDPITFGSVVTQGHRSDLQEIHADILAGETLLGIYKKYSGALRYGKGISTMITLLANEQVNRDRETVIIVLYGRSGSGKTSAAYRWFPDLYVADNTSHKWWDYCPAETAVLIDDFMGDYPYAWLMRFMDRRHIRVEVKGGIRFINPPVVIFTSILHPRDWYPGQYESGLRRRVEEGTLICTDEWPLKIPGTVNWDPEAVCPVARCPECERIVEKPHFCPDRPRPARRLDPLLEDTIEDTISVITETDLDDAQGSDSEVASIHSNLLAHIDAHPSADE